MALIRMFNLEVWDRREDQKYHRIFECVIIDFHGFAVALGPSGVVAVADLKGIQVVNIDRETKPRRIWMPQVSFWSGYLQCRNQI